MTLFSKSRTARSTSVIVLMLAGLSMPLLAQTSKYQKEYQDRVLGVQALSGQIVAASTDVTTSAPPPPSSSGK